MNNARKLKQNRKKNKFKKSRLKRKQSAEKRGQQSHTRGQIIEKFAITPHSTLNNGYRKCVDVQLYGTGEVVTAFVPYDGGINYMDEHDEVLLEIHSKSIGDLRGVKYKVINNPLYPDFRHLRHKKKRRKPFVGGRTSY